MTMYIFTPLNMILFTHMLGKGATDDGEEGHGHGESRKERSSTFVLLQKRADLVNKSETKFAILFKRLDEFFIKPLLIRDYENRIVSLADLASHQQYQEEGRSQRSDGKEDSLRPDQL